MSIGYSDPYCNAAARLIDSNRYGTGPDRRHRAETPRGVGDSQKSEGDE